MKKIIYLIASICLLTGCDLNVNTDPNYPQEVTNDLLIPSAENYISAKLGERIFNFSGFFAQYWDQAVEANQYNDEAEYNILQSFFNTSYRDLYAGALADLNVIKTQAKENDLWGDYLVASVLDAYTYQILVDCMDQAPYSEALQGRSNPTPHWDNGKDIYHGLINELDTALAKVNSNSIISSDMLLGKKVSQWIVFAKAMKLKLYMRSSFAEDNSAKIMTLVNDPELVMTSDIKMAIYSDAAEKRNPWYECNWSGSGLGTYNNIATYPIISYLKSTNDPRMSALYKKAANKGEYLGLIPGSKTKMPSGTKTNDYSFPIMTATTPVYFYTVSELNFFKAEAEARWGTNAAAKADYEAAIDANFNLHGTSGASAFVATDAISWDKATNLEQKLKLIGLQKWVALCMVNHFEGWTEIRRLHYPAFSASAASDIYSDESLYTPGDLIVPWVNNLGGTKVVKRVPFPETAVNYNKNTPAQVAVSTPVWWDVR